MGWICVQMPIEVLLPLGLYECPYCKKIVIVLSEKEENSQPRISNYSFCPFCGTKIEKETGMFFIEQNLNDKFYVNDSNEFFCMKVKLSEILGVDLT